MTDLPKATIDVLTYIKDGGASSEDLVAKFGEAVTNRISTLNNLKFIKSYYYPHSKITFYRINDEGKNYLEDITDKEEEKHTEEIKNFIRWIIPVIISMIALSLSILSALLK